MENEKKFFEFVGTASERAGTLAGKVASIGGKIANLASDRVSSGKEMLGLADKKVKDVSEKKPDNSNASTLKSDLAAARRKLTKAEKTQSKLESQLKELKTENQSLVSELDQIRSELSEVRSFEGVVRARAAALESELDDTRRELEEARSKSGKTTAVGGDQSEQAAVLESELAASQRELEEMRNEMKKTQSQFESSLKEMRAENESLIFKLADARKEAGDAGIRADSMDAQIPSPESDVAAFDLGVGTTCEEESDIDVAPRQTEPESSNENQAEIAVVPMEAKSESSVEVDIAKPDEQIKAGIEEQPSTPLVSEDQRSMPADAGSPQTKCQEKPATVATVEEIKPSIEVAAAKEEPIEANVENVEGPEPILEFETEIDVEEIEPDPIPEVEVTESLEVTAEEVQAADFKNGADKILFTKAVSDFASQEAASRADAAGVIAGIRHELSPRLLITNMVDEPSALVRRECVKALATLEMKEGISAIERALADEAASVRLAAVWGLYRLAGTESIQALIPMLSDRDASVRRRAITCIGWVGGQIAKIGNHCQQVISALIRCLNDPSESIKNATLDALQAVTGKKMPASRTSPERLAEQWRKWWKAELLG